MFSINIFKWLEMLIPSPEADPVAQYAWRKSVFIALAAILIMGGFSFSWAQGWIPGVSGVALSSDVVELRTEIQGDRKDNLENLILSMHDRRCLYISTNNAAAADAMGQKLIGLLNKYREISGHDYPPLFPC